MTDAARRLIVNADDFGWSKSVNHGIIETHVDGIVTSTSILAAGTDFEDAVELLRETPTLTCGVHLNFYRGKPVLPRERVSSLIGENGLFLGKWTDIMSRFATGRFDLGELEDELRAAITRVIDAGITPSHLNSEKHLHIWPPAFRVVARLADEFGIPYVRTVREPWSTRAIPSALNMLSVTDARILTRLGLRTADATIGVTYPPVTLPALERMLANPRGRSVELIVHPGRVDQEFLDIQQVLPNKLGYSREEELAMLTSVEARRLVEAAGYELTG